MKRLIRILLCLSMSAAAHAGSLQGRIDITGSAQPPRVIVKLTAPRNTGLPQEITASDSRGNFAFANLRNGRYLLEMYQGARLVRRQVVDINGNQQVNFTLHAVGR
jgi:hypothetical protein